MGGPPRCGRRRSSTYAPSWAAARWSLAIVLALSTCHPSPRTNPPSARTQSSLLALRRDVDSILAAPALERTSWGILVRSLTTNETLYSLGADKLLMPASALKIVTLAAAAERLGWSHTYETRIVTDGTVHGDTLDGNLVIVGSGDPSLDRPALESWTDQLKTLGVAKVTGGVRADSRAFAGAALGFGWSWDDVPYYYAAPIAAAQFHENAVDVRLTPGSVPGPPVAWELAPPGSGLSVTNRMTTGAAAAAIEFVARRAPGSSSVVLEGVVPAGGAPIVQSLSVDDPARYLAAAFTAVLAAKSVTVGNLESSIAPRGLEPSTVLIVHHSAPLSILARRLMEVSQNQYAETLIKTLGAREGAPTFEGGLHVVESVLASWGIGPESTVLRDGSGLSRYDYVAPDALVQVLTRMYRDPVHNSQFVSSLNVAAQTGTMAGRFRNTAAAGNARIKDGSMASVRSLCGIINTRDGEPLAFAILANNFSVPGSTVSGAIDAIVVRLAVFER